MYDAEEIRQLILDRPGAAFKDPGIKALIRTVLDHKTLLSGMFKQKDTADDAEEMLGVKERLVEWLDTPILLENLLNEMQVRDPGYYDRFKPRSRMVVRSAFRATDAIEALGLVEMSPRKFAAGIRHIERWMRPETMTKFGQNGRWWTRRSFGEEMGRYGFDRAELVTDRTVVLDDDLPDDPMDMI